MRLKSFQTQKRENGNSKTLHETVLKNFNKTPSGKIYEHELKDIYAMTIICMELKEQRGTKIKFNPLNKTYPFSFHIGEALETMKHLNVKIELSKTTTTISYSIKAELGSALLKKFFGAKLLHSPADRTRFNPKHNVLLQPTPKGVAIVQDFYKKIGGKRENLPPILLSCLNSMELFKFDRDPISDKILYSDYFLQLVFVKLMGEYPNTWSPDNKPDTLPQVENKLDFNEGYDFSLLGFDRATNLQSIYPGCEGINSWDTSADSSTSSFNEDEKKTNDTISPIYHRYFTNPESDSHIQYYVSNSGVRFHKNKVFSDSKSGDVMFKLCISGKAICQWLCDCTDIISNDHAIEIADLLLLAKLIRPITLYPSNANHKRFQADRNSFYILTKSGLDITHWSGVNSSNESYDVRSEYSNVLNFNEFSSEGVESFINSKDFNNPNESKVPIISLKDNLQDPGMRYLFKKHLENEFCSENLEAYLQLKQFEKKITILSKLLRLKKKSKTENIKKLSFQIVQAANTSLALAYHIYFTYLSSDSPFPLNINYNLKERIAAVMVNKSSVPTVDTQDYLKTPVDIKCPSIDSSPYSEAVNNAVQIASPPDTMASSVSSHSDDSLTKITGDSNIKRQDITYHEFDLGFISPAEHSMKDTLNILVQASSIFDTTACHIYRLMEVDSFPKFLNSELYQKATSTIELRKL